MPRHAQAIRRRFAARHGWWLIGLLACCGPAMATDNPPLSSQDMAWLHRDTFGLDSVTLEHYRELGRKRFLDEQLSGHEDPLPQPIEALIGSYETYTTPPADLAIEARDKQRQYKQIDPANTAAKDAAKKAYEAYRRELFRQSAQIELLHAVYGSNQLKEQMVWLWLNHFSIYAAKGEVGLFATDYTERVIRPYALGKFKDLVMATLESPAMQLYLDNAQNVRGKTNENYARELMELHTLGVNAGYTQQDVQQLALILTGAGIAPLRNPGLRARPFVERPGMVRQGLFLFNPDKHDDSDKHFLGQTIPGGGFDEIEKAVDLIVHQPACATFVSRKIAQYFVADDPPPELVEAMARTFQRTDGDIAAVLRTMFLSKSITAHAGKKFRDPTQFVVSAMRFSQDGKPITNAAPLVNWLNMMSQPVFGRITPDGWPLDGASWSGSGQMSTRFDVARIIGSGRNRLYTSGDNDPVTHADPPMLNSDLFHQAIEPMLSQATRDALGKAKSPVEWNTFLLSSPDFNYR